MDDDQFFEGHPESRSIFRAIGSAVQEIGPAETRVSRSQISFHRRHAFAAAWRPGQHLRGERPPLVLSVYLRRRAPSPRWKQVVGPRPGRFTHHLELRSPAEVDDEVRQWLAEAWRDAD